MPADFGRLPTQPSNQKGTTMFKTTVTRLFIGSLIAFGAGAIVSILAIALAIANDVFVMDGNDIAAIQGGASRGCSSASRSSAASWLLAESSPASSPGSAPC